MTLLSLLTDDGYILSCSFNTLCLWLQISNCNNRTVILATASPFISQLLKFTFYWWIEGLRRIVFPRVPLFLETFVLRCHFSPLRSLWLLCIPTLNFVSWCLWQPDLPLYGWHDYIACMEPLYNGHIWRFNIVSPLYLGCCVFPSGVQPCYKWSPGIIGNAENLIILFCLFSIWHLKSKE